MNKNLRPNQKPIIISCAETYGVERAANFHNVPIHLVIKWLNNKDKVLAASERHLQQMRDRAKKVYLKKGFSNKASASSRKAWYGKHIFKQLVKNLEKNIRTKGYDYPSPKPIDLARIAKKQRLICSISGIKLTVENISIDHINPLSKGGNNDLDNLQLLDKRVNLMKHAMPINELVSICKAIVDYQAQKSCP